MTFPLLYSWKVPRLGCFVAKFPYCKSILKGLTSYQYERYISTKKPWPSFASSVPGQGLSKKFLHISAQTETRWTSFPKADLLSAWWASWSLCCPPRSWTSVAGWDTAVSPPPWCLWVGSGLGACPPPWVPSCHVDVSHHVSHDTLRSQRVKTEQRNLSRCHFPTLLYCLIESELC